MVVLEERGPPNNAPLICTDANRWLTVVFQYYVIRLLQRKYEAQSQKRHPLKSYLWLSPAQTKRKEESRWHEVQ
jgi:hypothetical protein